MNEQPVRVLVIEDDAFSRNMVGATLARSGYAVAKAASASEAWKLADHFRPDVVVADLELPGGPSGLDAVRVLRQHDPELPAIILTNHRSPHLVQNAPASVAEIAYLVKADLRSGEELLLAIHAACSRRSLNLPQPHKPAITKAQAEVLRLMAEGLSNAQIAERRYSTVRAVELSIQRIYKALGLSSEHSSSRVMAVNMYRRSEVTVK